MRALLAIDIPNPLEPIGDALGGAASRAAEASFEFFMRRFAEALERAAATVVSELAHYLDSSSGVSLDAGWFASPRTTEILAAVGLFAAVLMVLFLLAAVIQGLLQGDATVMLRAAALEAPISVFAIVALAAVTQALLAITDAASSMVLANAGESLGRFFAPGQPGSVLTLGVLGFAMLGLFVLGSVAVWIELAVRSALIYFLLAVAPLVLAARVWPALRGAWHQLCRIGVALIVAKFAVALALALGVAALGGGGPQPGGVGTQAGLTVAGLVTAACLMLLAAFAPFVVLKLLPVFEAAVLAQGISRGPLRAGQTAVQSAYYVEGLKRLAGGGGGRSSGASDPSDGGGPSAGGGGSSEASGSPRGAAPAALAQPAGGSTAAANGPAAGSAGAAASGAAAVPVAGGIVVPVALARRAKASTEGTADAVGEAPQPPA